MARKIAISSSVLFCVVLAGIVFSLVGAEYPTDTANASALLEQAQAYEAEGNYEQAESIYRSIITDYPGTDEAFQAQKNLALLFVVTLNYSVAQAEVETLIADFPEHPQLPAALYDIANQYWHRGSYQQARELYKYIADNKTDSDWAITGQTWVAAADIRLGNYATAQTEIDALITDFAEHSQLTGVIYKLANEYWYIGWYEDARRFYKYALDRELNGELAIWARAWITGLELMLGHSLSAQEVIDTLIADCNGCPGLAEMIYGIANGCWYVGKYDQARILYKYIADNMSNSNFAPRAQLWVAGSDIILGNYAVAHEGINALTTHFSDLPNHPELARMIYQLAHMYWRLQRYEEGKYLCQLLLDNWPDSGHAGQALFLIANCYEKLRNSGSLPELEANPKIEQAYQAVVEKYPDSPVIREASIKLGWLNFKGGDFETAEKYFADALEEFPEGCKPQDALYALARICHKNGKYAKAEQAYTKLLEYVKPDSPEAEKVVVMIAQVKELQN